MLTSSFCCFRGFSPAAERKLWRAGCLDWKMLPSCSGVFSARRMQALVGQLPAMQAALEGRLAGYFLSRLPSGCRLRVLPEFENATVYLDIETTGLGRIDTITVIGIWFAGQYSQYVNGVNLEQFLTVISQAELLITFNGIRFDWPVVESYFGASFPVPHIDLMHEARSHGYAGGLKAIERRMGWSRAGDEAGDGLLATELWSRYKDGGDQAALQRLLCYNRADVRSLRLLSRALLKRSLENYPGPSAPF